MSCPARTSSFNPRLALVSAAVCALGLFNSYDASAALPPPGSTTKWTVTLPSGATTWKVSVGVYNAQGVLVRTLVRGANVAPGSISGSWDGKDDAGVAVPKGTLPANQYTIRLAYHNIGYAWEGVIGNTSSSFDTGVHSYLLPVNGLAIAGSNAYIAAGYNEGQPGLSGFALSTPNTALRQFASTDSFLSYAMVAADATRVYAANTGGGTFTSFVKAFDRLSPFAAVNFSSGQSVCLSYLSPGVCYPAQSYTGVIDLDSASSPASKATNAPTGIAVQQSGNVLAVAHGGLNLVRLFNKNTGAPLPGNISVPMSGNASKFNQISMTAAGDLWVISGSTVIRYTNLNLTGTPTQAAVISNGLVSPLALSAEGSGVDAGGVWVADGGTSQQIKRFTASGTAGSSSGDTKGAAGGYASSPAVSDTRLCFKVAGGERTALAAESNGSMWVADTCNNRMLRFAAGATTADTRVASLPVVYTSTVDHGNPSCVYANFLQFCHSGTGSRTDALVAGGAAWPLVKNWLPSLPAGVADASVDNSGFGGFTTVQTLSNGRTYGLINVGAVQKLVELPSSGPARLIGNLPQVAGATTTVMYEGGDLGYATTNAGAGTQTVFRQTLTGFNGSGDPQWGSAVSQATVPTTAVSAYSRAGTFTSVVGPRFPLTALNRVVFFDQSVTGSNFHLGAAALGDTKWLWLASQSGALDGKGTFQTRPFDSSVNYGGSLVWASGSNIVYGYQGTAFTDPLNGKAGYASQFMHFDVYGLFLGQFGESDTRSTRQVGAKLPLNPLSPTLVKETSGPLFLYTSDESGHGGVHRFRFDGLNTLGYRTSVPFTFGTTVPLN
ncbi:MAG: FlgD immunoglobulin-like domain containing protein [Burkholderiales bacterium]